MHRQSKNRNGHPRVDRGALADRAWAAKKLKEVAEQIAQALGKEVLGTDGNLAEAYHGTLLGKTYMDLKAKAGGGRSREVLEHRKGHTPQS